MFKTLKSGNISQSYGMQDSKQWREERPLHFGVYCTDTISGTNFRMLFVVIFWLASKRTKGHTEGIGSAVSTCPVSMRLKALLDKSAFTEKIKFRFFVAHCANMWFCSINFLCKELPLWILREEKGKPRRKVSERAWFSMVKLTSG